MKLTLFNSLSSKEEIFIPIDPDNITMYVCGPTVYDRPHIGNARSVVVYDMWFRFLKKIFPKVTYVRNITDVDDKINLTAQQKKISIQKLTTEITNYFHQDIKALNVLEPTFEPMATKHIKEMIDMISKIIEHGHAYISDSHVLFDVRSYADYGKLSKQSLDEIISGSRIEIATYKKDPLDFVLWKPSNEKDDISSIFDSPWGKGRPGWHIECSAMSNKYLSGNFDIHGGGSDLQFPHHENEIAQIKCYDKKSNYARYWVHNGFLTVNGEKMSKSLGNFVTVQELLSKGIPGVVLRYLMLATHYRKPIDFNEKALFDAQKAISKFHKVISEAKIELKLIKTHLYKSSSWLEQIIEILSNDLNTPSALAVLHKLTAEIKTLKVNEDYKKLDLVIALAQCLEFLGLYDEAKLEIITQNKYLELDESYILDRIEVRKKAREERNWDKSDKIRSELLDKNIILEDHSDGKVSWKRKES